MKRLRRSFAEVQDPQTLRYLSAGFAALCVSAFLILFAASPGFRHDVLHPHIGDNKAVTKRHVRPAHKAYKRHHHASPRQVPVPVASPNPTVEPQPSSPVHTSKPQHQAHSNPPKAPKSPKGQPKAPNPAPTATPVASAPEPPKNEQTPPKGESKGEGNGNEGNGQAESLQVPSLEDVGNGVGNGLAKVGSAASEVGNALK